MNGSLAKRYAKALIRIAGNGDLYSDYLKELEGVQEIFSTHSEFAQFIENPGVPLEKKKAVLEQLLKKLGLRIEIANFIRVLLDKKRMGIFDDFLRSFRKLADLELGQVRAKVKTLKANSAQVQMIKDLLSNHLLKNIIVEEEITDEILGGIHIQVEDLVFDGSMKAQLEQMKRQIEDLQV